MKYNERARGRGQGRGKELNREIGGGGRRRGRVLSMAVGCMDVRMGSMGKRRVSEVLRGGVLDVRELARCGYRQMLLCCVIFGGKM